MVSLKINLLLRRGASEIIRQRLFLKLKRSSVAVLVGYLVLLLVVFGVRLVISAQKDALENQVRQAKVRVDAFSATESQQVLLKSKLQLAGSVLQRRRDWAGFLGEVLTFIPDERAVADIALGAGGDLRIKVRTSKLQEMALMLKALVQLGLEHEQVESVSLGEVSKSDAVYQLTVVIGTKKVN